LNHNTNTTTFVAGLGATGSSGVVDLLKEVKSYFVFENEFRLFTDPGGIINLRDALCVNWSVYQTDIAIKNFLMLVKKLNNRFTSPYSLLSHRKYLDNEFILRSNKYINDLIELKYRGLWYGIDSLAKRLLNRYSIFHMKKLFTSPIYLGKKLSDKEFKQITNKYVNSLIDYCLKKYGKKNSVLMRIYVAYILLKYCILCRIVK